ncbi:MAG: M24 family metallopeptidase [Planctomycetaceae bacterium]|nr:M24 family metallopeptidase [Planctomycetaceae bacterium]
MFDLSEIQSSLAEFGFDAWLLTDFRGNNPLAQRVLELDQRPGLSRRWYYLIPAKGEPRKLQHRIEPHALGHLPGGAATYLAWEQLEEELRKLIGGVRRVAMEYAPGLSNPYLSRIDGGTVEFLRGAGLEIESSGNLIQLFEATWDDAQWEMHLEAEQHTTSAFDWAWKYIADEVKKNGKTTEKEVQDEIMQHFAERGMTTYHPPIVAVGPHSGDPHYETGTTEIREGDLVLIDLWAKMDRPRSVYSDLTRMGYVGKSVPSEYAKVFGIVAAARDAAIELVEERFRQQKSLQGWEVDRAARGVIEEAGYGDYFVHRTGHSIGQETHGNGANMDSLETREERLVLPRTCFSIEPGIYLKEFGIRSEINVFITGDSEVRVTGGPVQREILALG